MFDRLYQPPRTSFFLFGPRGTGKSTFVRSRFPDALVIDLLDPATSREMAARPEALKERVAALAPKSVVVLDEVQRVPALLDVVHELVEKKTGLRFVLTGSSARKLRRGGVDLLAGRAVLASLHPFLAAEMGAGFSLSRALELGTLPVVVDAPEPQRVLRAYAALYVREEVQQEGLVRSVGDFSRFLEVISFSHASQINLSSVARECAVGRKTVENYISILEDLLLAFRLPVFAKRAARAVVAHPKLYLFDAGVYRSLRPAGPLDRPEAIAGHALEGLVAQHLRAWVDYSENGATLSYWRTRAGNEVDFVIYGPGVFVAIEVKNARTVRGEDLRPLRAFHDEYPQARRVLLHRGTDRSVRDGVHLMPCDEFLRGVVPGEALPGTGTPNKRGS
jgi:predicted AAA+ superfamily ATPase